MQPEIVQLTRKELNDLAKTVALLSRESHESSMSAFLMQNKQQHTDLKDGLEDVNEALKDIVELYHDHDKTIIVMKDHVATHRRMLFGGATIILVAVIGSILSLAVV